MFLKMWKLFLMILLFICQLTFSQNSINKRITIDNLNTINNLKKASFSLLNSQFKKNRILYEMPHEFYIPMIYAFKKNDLKSIKLYQSCLKSNVFLKIKSNEDISNLDKVVFYFFLAEYLRLDKYNKETKKLFKLLNKEFDSIWLYNSGKVWSREWRNSKGKRERINNILKGKWNGNMSYYNAITDFELFPMAMAASLYLSQEKYSYYNWNLNDAILTFIKILKEKTKFYEDSTWVLQPNVWKQHRDFKSVKTKNNEDVVWDSSHFSRMPAYLSLLEQCYEVKSKSKIFIKKLKKGLAMQFVNNICYNDLNDNIYKFTNFVNGNDSSFRVGYYNKGRGYMSSENFKHVFLGWWKLLENKEVDLIYDRLEQDFYKYFDYIPNLSNKKKHYKEIIKLKI